LPAVSVAVVLVPVVVIPCCWKLFLAKERKSERGIGERVGVAEWELVGGERESGMNFGPVTV